VECLLRILGLVPSSSGILAGYLLWLGQPASPQAPAKPSSLAPMHRSCRASASRRRRVRRAASSAVRSMLDKRNSTPLQLSNVKGCPLSPVETHTDPCELSALHCIARFLSHANVSHLTRRAPRVRTQNKASCPTAVPLQPRFFVLHPPPLHRIVANGRKRSDSLVEEGGFRVCSPRKSPQNISQEGLQIKKQQPLLCSFAGRGRFRWS